MARIPDRHEHRRRFAALDVADRRKIIKAVNKGRPVDTRKHAPLAVNIARQQQRFWSWAWVVGPVFGLVQLRSGWEQAAVTGLFGTLVLFGICRFWVVRAKRAEQENLALLGPRKKR